MTVDAEFRHKLGNHVGHDVHRHVVAALLAVPRTERATLDHTLLRTDESVTRRARTFKQFDV